MTGSYKAASLSYATPQGTDHYRKRMIAAGLPPSHFRLSQGLGFSSIGLGTYLGDEKAQTDALYTESVMEAVKRGCNVIDSAINYRHQRSERAIGLAMTMMSANNIARREELILCTKGGYLPFDNQVPADPQGYITKTYIETGIIKPDDVVEWNCIAPKYIEDQIARSCRNLRTDCIDVYYLHNPEAQLGKRTPDEFYKSLRAAFELLEKKVAEGKIRMYGTATWNGYRAQRSARDYLSLERVVKTAEEVGGKEHHFMVVQLPYNLALPEALLKQNQPAGGELVGFFEAAQYFGITVMTSVPTMQGQLAKNLPPQVGKILPGLLTDAQRAIQFVRSTRGVTAALVGMKQKSHVAENLETGKVPPVSESSLLKLFEFK